MARRDENPPESLDAFAAVLDELAANPDVAPATWFGAPAAKVGGRIFLALWRGTLVARIGAEEVDARVLARDGLRFDPSRKGRAMKDWLESTGEPDQWPELAHAAMAFTSD